MNDPVVESRPDDVALVVPAAEGAPALRFRVTPLSCLYHYLVRQGQLPAEQRDPSTAAAAARAARVREPRGVHGPWDAWAAPGDRRGRRRRDGRPARRDGERGRGARGRPARRRAVFPHSPLALAPARVHIASTTEPLTGTAVMRLVDRGTLELGPYPSGTTSLSRTSGGTRSPRSRRRGRAGTAATCSSIWETAAGATGGSCRPGPAEHTTTSTCSAVAGMPIRGRTVNPSARGNPRSSTSSTLTCSSHEAPWCAADCHAELGCFPEDHHEPEKGIP
jgi:hypothetical protein